MKLIYETHETVFLSCIPQFLEKLVLVAEIKCAFGPVLIYMHGYCKTLWPLRFSELQWSSLLYQKFANTDRNPSSGFIHTPHHQ